MTNDRLADEIIDLSGRISALGEGHNNFVVMHALVNAVAIGVVNICRTPAELKAGSDELATALAMAIRGYWAKQS
jgi:hypothetical protein